MKSGRDEREISLDASSVRERGPDITGWSCVSEGEVREGQRWAELKREEGLEAKVVMAFGPAIMSGYADGAVLCLDALGSRVVLCG